MLNNRLDNLTTSNNIKCTVSDSISGTQKIFKTVLNSKIQLTYPSFLAGLMVVLMFYAPLLSLAQQRSPAAVKAITDGKADAIARTYGPSWFILGVVGGPITVLVTAFHKSAVPAETLLGKTPGYVEAYTKAYEAKIRSIRLRYATIGCVTGTTLGVLYGAYTYGYNTGHDDGYRDAYNNVQEHFRNRGW